MNLLEAVKSGKPFKRPGWDIWYKEIVNSFISGVALTDKEDNALYLDKQDVLAEDWVVEEELLPCPFPCPFCGEEVELKCDESYKKTPRTLKYLIKCETKDCSVRYFVNDGDFIGYLNADNISDNLKIFVEKWNNRVGKVRYEDDI